MSTGQSALMLCGWVAKAGLDVIKVCNNICYKEMTPYYVFHSINVYHFQKLQITEIIFPDSRNIGNFVGVIRPPRLAA